MNSTLAWARTFPSESEGWTLTCIERESRYWVTAQVGRKMRSCLSKGSRPVGSGQRKREFVRWFSDGERGYAQELWKLASVRLKYQEVSAHWSFD
jgi:hypothetical protein